MIAENCSPFVVHADVKPRIGGEISAETSAFACSPFVRVRSKGPSRNASSPQSYRKSNVSFAERFYVAVTFFAPSREIGKCLRL